MAIINKTGITNGGTIESEHITRIIDALSLGSSEIAATGSLFGTASFAVSASRSVSSSFATTASFALNASATGFPFTGSARITGSLIVTGSITNRNGNLNILGSSHTISASSDVLINSPSIRIEDTGGATILGINANLGDTSIIIGNSATQLDLSDIGNGNPGNFVVPTWETNNIKSGAMYWDDASSTLRIYSQTLSTWLTASFA